MDDFQTQFNQAIQAYAKTNAYGISLIPFHQHTGIDSPRVAGESLALTDSVTNNVSIATHGFVPKINNTSGYLKGDGTWAVPAGTGTVTSFAFNNANGFAGSVAFSTTTPWLTLQVNPTGIIYSTLVGGSNLLQGVAIPADATQFLNGSAAYAKVKDSDLSLSDITTNNVSSTAHGFAPKFPNNTTTFLRGDGTYAAPSASTSVYANGVDTSRDGNAVAGTQNIAHGLGVVPHIVKITAMYSAGSPFTQSFGVYNGTTNSSTFMYSYASGYYTYFGASSDTAHGIYLYQNGGGYERAVITVDATNIILTWTVNSGIGAGAINIMWECNS